MTQSSSLDVQYFLQCVVSYIRGYCAVSFGCDAGLIAKGNIVT